MLEKIQKVIEKIRPSLQQDGGDIELVEVLEQEGIVKVKLQGACAHCPMSTLTLKNLVEAQIKKEVPEIKEVISV